jgi:F0F1-type ATP synthase alpha subunit
MQLNPSEISDLIKQKIEQFDLKTEARAEGTIVSLTDGIVRIYGLSDAQYYEMLEFPNNTFGLALNLERDSVGAVILGDYTHLTEGDWVRCTGRVLEVPVGEGCLAASSIHSARRLMARDQWTRRRPRRSRRSPPASSRGNRSISPCRPASRRLMPWCRSDAGNAS